MLVPSAVSAEFFHTAAGTAFADLLINGNRETWPIRSKRFSTWLRRCHYEATGAAASAAKIRSALDLFEAQAQFDGPERAVHVRLAEHAGRIYLDLADERWRAVEIGPDGWRVVGSPPVRFRRAVLSKLLKDLVDPNVAPVRALAREERDLVIAANNSHVLAFDNLSGLPHALSDAFCRLATGASFGLRQLYTDPVAARVRELMASRTTWTGSASDLLRAGADREGPGLPSGTAAWPKNPRALAGRLRRAQAFLRVMGVHIAFSREGRAGTRVIRIRRPENTVSTVSTVSIVRDNDHDPRSSQPPPVRAARDDSRRPEAAAADDADGADAKSALHFR